MEEVDKLMVAQTSQILKPALSAEHQKKGEEKGGRREKKEGKTEVKDGC